MELCSTTAGSCCSYTSKYPLLDRWLLRPALWTCLISVLAYCDPTALRGRFVYDDAGSVSKNVVVNGRVPWRQAFSRDFWGSPMTEAQSHKSFRPITTLSFRLNWILSEKLGTNGTDDHTFGFHLTNVILHGVVTGLVTEASSFVFDQQQESDIIAQIVTGLVFGLHPVHAEAVSNITSRGELLMSFFCLVAFLSYVHHIPTKRKDRQQFGKFRYVFAVYIVPWICMTLSLFSKEQGATTLITLVAYDFIQHYPSLVDYLTALFRKRDRHAFWFLRRTTLLAIQTVAVCLLRYWLNGETSPDFIDDQNPAGFAKDRFTRVFSVSWVNCLYAFDALFPKYLCPDWSGVSIDLIRNVSDGRIMAVLALWSFAGGCAWSLLVGLPPSATKQQRYARRVTLQAFFAFTFSPFLLSSNLLVVVGLMKADRVIYMPLFGFCLLEALALKTIFCDVAWQTGDKTANKQEKSNKKEASSGNRHLQHGLYYWLGYALFMLQLTLFCGKLHERNLAWSDPLRLWMGAYAINKKSHHTMYNCGYELSLRSRFKEAEMVLRPIGSAHVAGPSNTFVYAMVLFNLHRCNQANKYLDEAFEVLEENKREGGVRNDAKHLARIESNLLVARSHCAGDVTLQGQILFDAVKVDQTNEYAVQQATELMKRIDVMKKHGLLN